MVMVFLVKDKGAFHYAKDSGNFGRNSNGKVCFGFLRPEYSGSPLELVHLFRENTKRGALLHGVPYGVPKMEYP